MNFRKGFLSFILAMAFAASILLVFSAYQSMSLRNAETETEMLLIELHTARELELKRALMNSVVHEGRNAIVEEAARLGIKLLFKDRTTVKEALKGLSGEKIVATVGRGLGMREARLEGAYKELGLDVDFWCGAVTQQELHAMPERMLNSGNLTKCSSDFPGRCYDLNFPAVRDDEIVTVCTGLLAGSIGIDPPSVLIKVSNFDQKVTPLILPIGDYVFGISILDRRNGMASVVTLPVGSGIKVYSV